MNGLRPFHSIVRRSVDATGCTPMLSRSAGAKGPKKEARPLPCMSSAKGRLGLSTTGAPETRGVADHGSVKCGQKTLQRQGPFFRDLGQPRARGRLPRWTYSLDSQQRPSCAFSTQAMRVSRAML